MTDCVPPLIKSEELKNLRSFTNYLKLSNPSEIRGQNAADGQRGTNKIATVLLLETKKCLIHLGIKYIGGTKKLHSFYQSIANASTCDVSGHQYFE